MDGTQQQTPEGAATMMAGLTTTSLVLIAVFAVVVVIGILYGMKLKRDRLATRDDLEARNETVTPAADAVTERRETPVAPEPEIAAPTGPAPVTPAPPPLADEPVVAAAPFDASPASIAADAPRGEDPGAAPPTVLKGLGPKLAATLAGLGITRIDQIAALSVDAADELDAQLGAFRGRIHRDRWIEQAKLLSAGDRAGFEREFGKL